MKIAVFHNLPSGGAKRALHGNVNFLAKDHEIDVFVPSTANEDYLPLKHIVDDLNIYPVKNTLSGFLFSAIKYRPSKVSLKDLEITQKRIANDINEGDYDIVLVEQDRHTMAPFFLKYIKKPHVYYCQQPNIFRNEISRRIYKNAGLEYKNLLETLFLKFYSSKLIKTDKNNVKYSKYIVVNSNFSKKIISRIYGINSHVSYLGVNNQIFKPLEVPKENFVLSVGQCIPEKGYEFILNSLAKIDINKRPEFYIVSDQGNIHWKRYLEKLAIKLNVKLRISNLISDKKLVCLYNQAKLVVYAPYLEPFGLVPLEAMSCGTPVVGVNEGGVRESVLNGSIGVLTERDEDAFANGITELLLNSNKYQKMAEESIKVVNDFWTLNDSGKRLLNHLYRSIDVYDGTLDFHQLD